MAAEDGSLPARARLNPFAFPSDTDYRFVLLIVAVLGASLFIYSALFFSLPITRDYWLGIQNECLAINPQTPANIEDFNEPRFVAARAAYNRCRAPAERANAAWMAGGVSLLLLAAGLLYWTYPNRKIKIQQLEPLSAGEAPEVLDYLERLCRESGIAPPPVFLWKPLDPASSGLAFGRLGKYYVSLSGGLVTKFYTDRPAFRAVVLHELAHLRNADVNKTYFAVAVWQAFLITGLLPFSLTIFSSQPDYIFSQAWRVAALTALVYWMRNEVLRTREMYADVRASAWEGDNGALSRVLGSLPPDRSKWWLRALQQHPDPLRRQQAVADPGRLFPMSTWDGFAAGVTAAIALPNIIPLIGGLLTGTSSAGLESLASVLLVAPLVTGVVGSGAWRATFASMVHGQAPRRIGLLGLGLALGILTGTWISFSSAIQIEANPILPGSDILFNILWGMLLLTSLFFFVRWIAAGASTWLEIATSHATPRPFYLTGLAVASGVLAIWLGLLFYARGLGDSVLLVLASPLGALWTIVENPLTLILLVSLWAFPLAAWFGQQWKSRGPGASWAFLSPQTQPMRWRAGAPVRPWLAISVGIIGGAAFWILLFLVRIVLRALLSEELRGSDGFRLGFFLGQVALAVILQAGVAAVLAAWVRRLGALHGLFGAFVAGCVMAAGILLINLLFGGEISLGFAWSTFSQVVNEGALLSLPVAWGMETVRRMVRGGGDE